MPLSEIATDVIYAYKMGVKTLYYANTDDGKTDEVTTSDSQSDCTGGACTL